MAGKKSQKNESLRERQRDFARTQFLEIGLQLFYEQGYAQATIEELAERCGCAKGTIYSHFPDGKDDLFRAIYHDLGQRFVEAFEMRAGEGEKDVIDLVDTAAEILLQMSAEPGKGRFFMVEAPALPHVLKDELGRSSRKMIKVFSEAMAEAQRGGQLSDDFNPQIYSYLFVGMLRESSIRVAAGEVSADEMLTAIREVAARILSPLATTPAPA